MCTVRAGIRAAPGPRLRLCLPSRSPASTARPATSRAPSTSLVRGIDAERALPDPARRDRHRQDVHDGQRHRARAEADAGDRPQQDARGAALQRVPRVLPRERGRVLRLVLRLLPARGLPAGLRHLHREGLVDQRRHRPPPPRGHVVPVRAPRRRHRGLGVVHLRPRLAGRVRGAAGHAAGGRGAPPRRASCAAWSTSSTSATTPCSGAPASAPAAT